MDDGTEEMENKEEQDDAPQMETDSATETKPEPEIVQTEDPEPKKTEEKEPESLCFSVRPSRLGSKRHAAQEINTPKKKQSPPKKCLTSIAPHMRSFMHTVQKNQMLMMTPGSLGRSTVMKSFIKQSATKTDVKLSSSSFKTRVTRFISARVFIFMITLKLSLILQERERQKWDALNKKIEQENERKKKIEEERRKKQEEMKRKRDERLKRVVEARVKGEKEKEQEKKKKIEEKMAQLEKKNDMEEEEQRHQEMLAKRRAEEEREKARKLAEATRALELKKELEREKEKERERERELERERQAAAEKERLEREKAIALQKELERAAREKERRELEEKRKMEEQRKAEEEKEAQRKLAAAASAPAPPTVTAQVSAAKTHAANMLNTTVTKSSALNMTVDIESSVLKTPVGKGAAHNKTIDHGAGLNVTVDIEQSPQSYQITPKGQKVTVLVNPEDYGMDQNSDDSTDDESAPRKPIPSWAEGTQLQQAIMKHYYNPLDLNSYFGEPEPPKLEAIFRRTKPRFFKRTSSAVWHSPPRLGNLGN
ncbi:hypothetical protein cypCar_00045139 [Cyprinus carpio]|nr:hypothetical protein cypCar_00045139 [Cyprinus carpio]